MKRLLYLSFVVLMMLTIATPASAQSKSNDDTLRILAIGNSFSDDGMEYLPSLLENLGVESVELARLYVGGCSLERHMQFYDNNEAAYTFYHSKAGENKWHKSKEKASIQQALAMGEWDIITMQQASGDSGLYETYTPHLARLIDVIKQAQPNAKLAWHNTWAYSTDSDHRSFPRYDKNQTKMHNSIIECLHTLLAEFDEIDVVIPSGIVIQSLRGSAINNYPKDLTRDGFHMDHGAGRYALACIWYETLVAPYTGKSMMYNTLRVSGGMVSVSDVVALYCQQAAKQALKHPFEIRPVKVSAGQVAKSKGNKEQTIIK